MAEHYHVLSPGTVLDERYRLDAVLGQGGFGITYAAENVRVGLRVAIKELFWKGHSSRNAALSPEVALENARDIPEFEAQKARFMREAQIIRDFSNQQGVSRILDFFEANGTAYIVMEYVEGETLAAKLAREGAMPAEDAFRRFLPLIESLSYIHHAGVIHRDISPDNIMVQPDGSLKLIDFGAARQYLTVGEASVTAIAKDSYAPGEQYDRNGKQGPWTDVYSLCATLYTCLTATPPPNAVQRMFLDELQKPSALVPSVPAEYEAIVMTGLQLEASQRWPDMGVLAEAVRQVLPDHVQSDRSHRGFVCGVLAVLVVALVILGVWGYRQYDITHKFRGVRTVDIQFFPTEGMSALAFGEAQTALRKKIEAFAGSDNYILQVDGVTMKLTLPLATFDGQGIDTVLEGKNWKLGETDTLDYRAELVVNWEDPEVVLAHGKNQVATEDLVGRTGVFAYACEGDELTASQRASAVMDFKMRLDALDRPYAFGTVYGHDDWIAFRMSTERLGPFLMASIGRGGLYICGESSADNIVLSRLNAECFDVESVGDNALALVYTPDTATDQSRLDEMSRNALARGEDMLYLEDSEHHAIAAMVLDAPLKEGRATFSRAWFKDDDVLSEEDRWLADYLTAILKNTDLPGNFTLRASSAVGVDGRTDFGGFQESEFGVVSRAKKCEASLGESLEAAATALGYRYKRFDTVDVLFMDIPMDNAFLERAEAELSAFVEEAGLADACINRTLIVELADEAPGELCRVVMGTNYDYGAGSCFNYMTYRLGGSARTEALLSDFEDWWSRFPVEELGFSRSFWRAE